MVVNEPMPRQLPPSYIGIGRENRMERTEYKLGIAGKNTF
jgi:hypothetical protein